MERFHATTVALKGQAVLFTGAPGAGKSDLALRLIDQGWDLVSDDYTELYKEDNVLLARAPDNIRDLLEVRGLGIVRLNALERARVAAVFELVPLSAIERLPEPATIPLLGVAVPLFRLHAFDASAPAKVRLALRALAEDLIQPS